MPLIGNQRTFALELQPVVPSWETRYPPERAAWAGTAIWVGHRNLCAHVPSGSDAIENYFYVPLGPIADWMIRCFPAIEFEERAANFPTTRHLHDSAERWWRTQPASGLSEDAWFDLRDEWWSRHFLRAGAEGAILPDLGFVRDDEELVISWAFPQHVGDDQVTMLSTPGDFGIPWTDGYAVLRKFISEVANWLRGGPAAEAYAWASEQDPLPSVKPPLSVAVELFTARSTRELERLFGVAEFDAVMRSLQLDSASRDPAASPECQILRDLSPALPSEVGALLVELGEETQHSKPEALGKWRAGRAVASDVARPAHTVEEAGQLAASEIRRELGLDGQPIQDVRAVLARFGLPCEHSPTGVGDRMVVAAREGGSLQARTLRDERTETPWGRRFEECRALGHVLLDPIRAGAIGAGSGPFAQETRRRRSGAFAAELLLPATALAAASNHAPDGVADDRAFQTLLEQYRVGARTAANQLYNRGWLSSTDVRDQLIDRFSATSPATALADE